METLLYLMCGCYRTQECDTERATMRRRRLTVWLLLLVAAHGARTADPQRLDPTATNLELPETTTGLSLVKFILGIQIFLEIIG